MTSTPTTHDVRRENEADYYFGLYQLERQKRLAAEAELQRYIETQGRSSRPELAANEDWEFEPCH